MFCGGCGSTVIDGSKFCQKCGRPVAASAPPPASVQPVAPPPPPPPPPVIAAPPQAYAPPAAPAPPPPAPPVYSAPPVAVVPPPPPPAFAPSAAGAPVYAAPQPGVPYAGPRYAGFWLRFVAYLIDGLIIGIPLGVICVILFFAFGGLAAIHGVAIAPNPDPEAALAQAQTMIGALIGFYFMFFVVGIVGAWLYYAILESSARQATFGKSVMSLYVTDMNGNRLTFGRASGRFFSKIVTGLVPLAIGYIMAGFTEKKQALHDFIAATLVFRR